MNRLAGKVAILTGASGGICGKAAEFFCDEGARVVMVGRSARINDDCAALVAKGGDAIAVMADASTREGWEKILEATIAKYGTVDICVNGAAQFVPTLSGNEWNDVSVEGLHEVLDKNLDAVLHSYQTVLQYMVDNGIRGNFINFTSSTALSWNGSGFSPYAISKAAILNVTQNMVKTVSPTTGIRFNCLAPNFVWTPSTDYLYQNEAIAGWFKAVCPFPNFGEPEDPAWAMVYLASDEAKYINGVCLPVDGGWLTCN